MGKLGGGGGGELKNSVICYLLEIHLELFQFKFL